MKTIKENITYQKIIQKSKFIAEIRKIENKNDMNDFLEEMKNKWPNATHYTYAYRILPNDVKVSDDGEPSKTAGFPILNVIEKKELNNIGCIVIRYFGGIKLGAGGLVRAYTNTVVEAIQTGEIINLIPAIEIELIVSYENWSIIQNIEELKKIVAIKYNENIVAIIKIEKDKWNYILDKIKLHIIKYTVINNTYIEKK